MEIKVDYKDSLELEKLQYEVFVRQNILIFLIQMNSNKKDNFNKIHKEYINFYQKYEKAKRNLEYIYLKNINRNFNSWDLNFNTQILTVNF